MLRRRRRGAAAALLVLAVACGGGAGQGEGPRTVTIAGEEVAVAPLVDAHEALCEAGAQPDRARELFFDRSHDALHTVARALEDVDRARAAELLEAKERVEAQLAGAGARPVPGDVSRLAGVYRASLGRLAIEAPPCD